MSESIEPATDEENAIGAGNRLMPRFIRGLGYLPGYGHHPGWPVFAFLVTVACIFGLKIGLAQAALQAGVMSVFVGPPMLIGAHNRARGHDRRRTSAINPKAAT